MEQRKEEHLSLVLTSLMKGIVYREDKPELWNQLLNLQGPVRDYLKVMGLDVSIYETDGFAYLETLETGEGESPVPRLIIRRQLSYPVSLMLALLRRKLTEHDAYSGEVRLILDKDEVTDMLTAFFSVGSNEVKYLKRIDSYLQKINDLGFIRLFGDKKDKIEVKRILKAFVDAQWLSDLDARLEEYRNYGENHE